MVPARPGIRRGSVERGAVTAVASAVLWTAFPAVSQDTFVPPEAPPAGRFAPIWERSPFTLKTVGETPLPAGASFGDAFALAGLSDVGGNVTVYLKNKSSGAYLTLSGTGAEPESGIAFVSLLAHDDPRKVKVRLRKGAELAEVGYAPEQFQTAGSAPLTPAGASTSALGRAAAGPNPASSVPNAGSAAKPGGTAPPPTRRRIILPSGGPPQASVPPVPEPVRTALLDPSHAPSPSIPLAVRALPTP
jgi:hypothetical protein